MVDPAAEDRARGVAGAAHEPGNRDVQDGRVITDRYIGQGAVGVITQHTRHLTIRAAWIGVQDSAPFMRVPNLIYALLDPKTRLSDSPVEPAPRLEAGCAFLFCR